MVDGDWCISILALVVSDWRISVLIFVINHSLINIIGSFAHVNACMNACNLCVCECHCILASFPRYLSVTVSKIYNGTWC